MGYAGELYQRTYRGQWYNYVWRTRLPKESGQYRVPAAMAAGVVKSLWSFENLYEEVTAA